ncbi:hypothetical protein KR222_001607 [Zaprionus bogoriensis]|nr:hypothetical protein KR222_001607 [Zaprionus bogoriensis]
MSLVSDQEWADYKAKFDKQYDGAEDQKRRSLYEKAKDKIEAHNKKFETGEVTWKMGINHLADATEDEFAARCGSKKPK